MIGNYLQQTTSADNIFRCIFFLALQGLTVCHCSMNTVHDRAYVAVDKRKRTYVTTLVMNIYVICWYLCILPVLHRPEVVYIGVNTI